MNSEELESGPRRMGDEQRQTTEKEQAGEARAPAKGGTVGCFVTAQIPIV